IERELCLILTFALVSPQMTSPQGALGTHQHDRLSRRTIRLRKVAIPDEFCHGFCCRCFSDSSIAFRNFSTAATFGPCKAPFALYCQRGGFSSGLSTPPR